VYKKSTGILTFILTIVVFAASIKAQNKMEAKNMLWVKGDNWNEDYKQFYKAPFNITNPDKELSPYTGMSRDEWIKCGIHMLEGAFQYVNKLEDPMLLPKFPGITYPEFSTHKVEAAVFEAVARTFNIAAPLIAENPDLTINGINLKDYYKYHFLQILTNKECEYYIGETSNFSRPYQSTCELGNLAMWNLIAPDAFWNLLSKKEKEEVADTFRDWSVSYTYGQNWRYFNVMMMTFLSYYEYDYNQSIMNAHMDNLILRYVGDGWYRDHSYDYYTMHVFQLYNNVWLKMYGKEKDPARAAIVESHMTDFYKNYATLFGKNGEINMYGRSILYRLGANACMPAQFLGDITSPVTPGEARRVASSSLLQFTTHPDFLTLGVPALGFYGTFKPCIQPYSCSASPYWMFMCFTALTLPENHPFWTETEVSGYWETVPENESVSNFYEGAGMLVTNHGGTGSTEYRPNKIHNTNPNYCRMTYNTAFPWEANADDGIISSELTVHYLELEEKPLMKEHVDIAGYRDGVLYRQVTHKFECFTDVATIIIPDGEIRIDRIRKVERSNYYLGHYSMPHLGDTPVIERRKIEDKEAIIVSNKNRKLAITNYMGWNSLETKEHIGLHPESEKSTLLYAANHDGKNLYDPVTIAISVLMHRTNSGVWTNDELQPIAQIKPLRNNVPIHLGGFIVELKNGKSYTVDYGNIDNCSSRH